jgi:hypothetical protein
MDVVSGLLLASAFAVLQCFTAYVIASTLCAHLPTLTRWAAIAATLAGLCTAIFHLLVWQRAFNRWTVLACTVLAAAVAWVRIGGAAQVALRLQRERRFVRRVGRRLRRSPYRFVALGLILLPLPAIARALVLPPLGWDALTYHAVKAAMWVQHGGGVVMNGPGPWAYYANMPAGAEVLQAWTMLPMSSDAFTTALDVVEWLAAGLGIIVVARSMGAKEPLPSIAAAFVLSIPPLRLMLGSGYAEPFLISTLFIGLALLLNADRAAGALILGGLALGLAAAAKVSVLPIAAIALVISLVRWTLRGGDKRVALTALLMCAMPVVPWFAMNAVMTGLPLSPFDVHVGSIQLGAPPPEYVWYVDRGVPPSFAIGPELEVLKETFTWPWHGVDAPGAFCIVPFLAMWPGVVWLVRRNLFAATLAASVLAACVDFYFSRGFAPIRFTFPQNSGRFLLPAIAVATLFMTIAPRRRVWWRRTIYTLLAICAAWYYIEFALTGFSPTSERAAAAVLVALGLLLGLVYLTTWIRSGVVRVSARVVLVGTGLFALVTARDTVRHPLMHTDHTLHWFADWRYWADAATIMDVPNQHLRLAVTGGAVQNQDNWFVYPFMGRRLQNEILYVPPTGDGKAQNYDGDRLWIRLVQSSNYWAWRLRLDRQQVSHVMSFRPASIELGWMEEHPESFERLAGRSGDWGLFAVRPGSAGVAN